MGLLICTKTKYTHLQKNKTLDFSNYKFRCSSLGKIVSKSGNLTQTTKTFLLELWIKEKFCIEKDINSKYLEKGISCESDGRSILQKVFYRDEFVSKNKIRLENDFLSGEYDYFSNTDNTVTDIKNAWDLFSFHKAELTHDYKWQLKGYAMLLGIKKCRLLYCLNDMPDFLLCEEEKKMFYNGKFLSTESQEFLSACQDLRKKYTYGYLKLEERFKYWHFECTNQDIDEIKKSVELSRKYLIELENNYYELKEKNICLIFNKNP